MESRNPVLEELHHPQPIKSFRDFMPSRKRDIKKFPCDRVISIPSINDKTIDERGPPVKLLRDDLPYWAPAFTRDVFISEDLEFYPPEADERLVFVYDSDDIRTGQRHMAKAMWAMF